MSGLQQFRLDDLAPFTREKAFGGGESPDYRGFYVGRDDVHGILRYLLSRCSRSFKFNQLWAAAIRWAFAVLVGRAPGSRGEVRVFPCQTEKDITDICGGDVVLDRDLGMRTIVRPDGVDDLPCKFRLATLARALAIVMSVRKNLEVVRVHASAIFAEVVKCQSLWYRPEFRLEVDFVGILRPSIFVQAAIASLRGYRPDPAPAWRVVPAVAYFVLRSRSPVLVPGEEPSRCRLPASAFTGIHGYIIPQ